MSGDVTREELAGRLDDESLTILDVRTAGEFDGTVVTPCDGRGGHIPGARTLEISLVMQMTPEHLRSWLGLPEGAEIVAYCHSGGRSAIACSLLRAAGFEARNYVGSWHEWSHDPSLPGELRD